MQETARQQIQELVERYRQLDRHARSDYNETATRTNFIDPLFAALGWNMQNNAEVAREEGQSVRLHGPRKRVDYAFKINGVTRFLLEAKKLGAELVDPIHAKQATDYAWNRGVDWVVLTNFHELKVYFVSETHRTTPVFSLGHEEFERRFDELRLLSKASIRNHELQQRAVGIPRRQPVDQQLYEDLKGWRRDLLANLSQYHPAWSAAQREEATQLILNRLIFIRNVEDREIEDPKLLPLLRQLEGRAEAQLPQHLARLFRDMDEIYNAQLFAKHFCEDYAGPAEPLVKMVRGLNHRIDATPYDFAAIGADVLGTIYEQYLTLAQAEQARRKQQGIYYTPLFVVRYIVRNTVLKALEAARERGGLAAARRVRVLDPACGSGSFLIAAFDALDGWLREHDPELQDAAARKQHILRENLYGVDLDPQAVAVTRLNLWLRAVERRAKLPEIPNVRHGDSLVDEAVDWTTAFDWQEEFPEVMDGGGFDVVLGNPPYVRYQDIPKDLKAYVKSRYTTYAGKADLYVYFYERAHELLRSDGYFGFVSSKQYMRSKYGEALRNFITANARIQEIVDFGELPVFQEASTFPAIVMTQKAATPPEKQIFWYTPVKELPNEDLDESVNSLGADLDERSLQGGVWALAPIEEMEIFLQMREAGIALSSYLENTKVFYGHISGWDDAFIISENIKDRICKKEPKSKKFIHPLLRGDNIRRFRIDFKNEYVITIPKGHTFQSFGDGLHEKSAWHQFNLAHPVLAGHLTEHKEGASTRVKSSQGNFWWECMRREEFLRTFNQPKIIYPTIAKESRFAYDTLGHFLNSKGLFIPTKNLYLLGVLNSILIWSYSKRHLSVLGDADKGGRLEWHAGHVSRIPIPPASPDDPRRQTIERAVAQALEIAPREAQALPGSNEQQTLRRELDRLDAAIDEAVCGLYGLSDEQRVRVLGV